MKTDIGVPAGISSPATSGAFSPLANTARAFSLTVLGMLANANNVHSAVTVIPGTSNSTMSDTVVQTFEDDGTGDAGRAEELSTSPGMSKISIGSSIIGCYQTVINILISEEDGVAGGTLFLPWHHSLNGIPANTDLSIAAETELMLSVDRGLCVSLSKLGKTMQIGFGDGPQPVDIKAESTSYSIQLPPGARSIDVINYVYSYRMGTQAESIVQPYFVANVPEPSSAGLGIGGAAFLLAMRRRRNSTMTA